MIASKLMSAFIVMIAAAGFLSAQSPIIPFDEAHWVLGNARVLEHQGRQAIMGMAILKDTVFENGVIEYDLLVSGGRSYPGVMFRSQPDGSWERFYIRPHRSGRIAPSLYSDVLQYLPAWNRADSWQLYLGEGYTAGSVIPSERWFHVKIEVSGDRARVFIDNREQAELVISQLRHGQRKGGIMLSGPADGSAYFSQVSVREDNTLDLGPRRRKNQAFGFVRDWQLSQVLSALDLDASPNSLPASTDELKWREQKAEENGMVNVARLQGRNGPADTVFLRTILNADQDEVRSYRFGYSDTAVVYLNGQKFFAGDSIYQGRDPSFLGIVGLNDTITLSLKKGQNELLVMLTEYMGGWGFMMQDAAAEIRAAGLTRVWQTQKNLDIPESVAYDGKRQMLYISNYDPIHPSQGEGLQSISWVPLSGGQPQELVKGLRNPTGLAVYKDKLFAVEAQAVVEIDLVGKRIVGRIDLPQALRLNDIALDGKGVIYVSDSQGGVIYRIVGGKSEVWLNGPQIARPNGLCLDANRLVFVNNGDGYLKAVDLKTKQLSIIADIAGGIGDGLAQLPDGSFLVSHNEGRLLAVNARGDVKVLLDLTVLGINIADFVYITEENMLIFPSFYDKRLVAEKIETISRNGNKSLPLSEG